MVQFFDSQCIQARISNKARARVRSVSSVLSKVRWSYSRTRFTEPQWQSARWETETDSGRQTSRTTWTRCRNYRYYMYSTCNVLHAVILQTLV